MAAAIVKFQEVSKEFGSRRVLDQVSWTLEEGAIHALAGENGAGKSTLLKLLYGELRLTSGQILVRGLPLHAHSPRRAMGLGIGMVHQHFMLAGPLSGLTNIMISAPSRHSEPKWLPLGFRKMMPKQARQEIEKLQDLYGLHVELEKPTETLSVGEQQRLEILKLLYQNAQVLILDEPTAVLTPVETRELFVNIRKLREQGKTVIIVSHKLREIMELADNVAILRQGKISAVLPISSCSPEKIANLMVGHELPKISHTPASQKPNQAGSRDILLEMKQVSLRIGKLQAPAFNLSCLAGQVVGIAGVEGNGQQELVQMLMGPGRSSHGGTIHCLGHNVSTWLPEQMRALPFSIIPADRHQEGLVLDGDLAENFLLGRQRDRRFGNWGRISWSAVRKATQQALEEFKVTPCQWQYLASSLSGGNQQKLIAAREFGRSPRLVLAVNPTRGVDIGAMSFIHQQIREAQAAGCAVLLISSDLDELLALADPIHVLFKHSIQATIPRAKATYEQLGLALGGSYVGLA